MNGNESEILELEHRFWQAMCDLDLETATSLLDDEAANVTSLGVVHFDRARYREMAENGSATLQGFTFFDQKVIFPITDVAIATYKVDQDFTIDGQSHHMTAFDSTTWVKKSGRWMAAAHTETPEQPK